MTTGTQERDDETGLAGLVSVVSGPPLGEPVSIGSLAAIIVSDAAVKMRGQFQLPRVVAATIQEGEDRHRR